MTVLRMIVAMVKITVFTIATHVFRVRLENGHEVGEADPVEVSRVGTPVRERVAEAQQAGQQDEHPIQKRVPHRRTTLDSCFSDDRSDPVGLNCRAR